MEKTLRLRVKPAVETKIRQGHPWIFSESITELSRDGKAGELAVVYDKADKFLAAGLYDPASPIRVRVVHFGKPVRIDDQWWQSRLEEAVKYREQIIRPETTGYRVVHGENDGFPGLVIDRYSDVHVIKIYSEVWLAKLELLKLLGESLSEQVVLRLSRNIQSVAQKYYATAPASALVGTLPEKEVIFRESGIAFEADVLKGQKTGFFLDQRENRIEVQTLAQERRVLNCFSFSGGFSLYAAKGEATVVRSVDISAHALASAERNFALNKADNRISKCEHLPVKADVFEYLDQNKETFDLIVLDPPSMAKRATEKETALKAYSRLAKMAARHLVKGGILVACSCSAHITAEEFFQTVSRALHAVGRNYVEIKRTGHAGDHPAKFAEAFYLKAIYLSVS